MQVIIYKSFGEINLYEASLENAVGIMEELLYEELKETSLFIAEKMRPDSPVAVVSSDLMHQALKEIIEKRPLKSLTKLYFGEYNKEIEVKSSEEMYSELALYSFEENRGQIISPWNITISQIETKLSFLKPMRKRLQKPICYHRDYELERVRLYLKAISENRSINDVLEFIEDIIDSEDYEVYIAEVKEKV